MLNAFLFFLFISLPLSGKTEDLTYEGKGVTLKLLSDHESVRAGETVTVGLQLSHEEGYHTYWKNPGIIGFPVTLKWTLPENVKEPVVEYPYPERTKMAVHPCYGYEREVIILSTFTIPADWKAEEFQGRVNVSWMCCSEACCPDEYVFKFSLPVGEKALPSAHKTRLEKAREEIPLKHDQMKAELHSTPDESVISLSLSLPPSAKPLHLFSEDNQSSSDVKQTFSEKEKTETETVYEIILPRYKFSPKGKEHFPFLLHTTEGYHVFSPRYLPED